MSAGSSTASSRPTTTLVDARFTAPRFLMWPNLMASTSPCTSRHEIAGLACPRANAPAAGGFGAQARELAKQFLLVLSAQTGAGGSECDRMLQQLPVTGDETHAEARRTRRSKS